MKNFTLKVKDLECYIKSERISYATGDKKRFFISLHCGPNYKRYTVQNMVSKEEFGFIKKGEAIKFFNELFVEEATHA